jgi:hypothetical protein
VCWIMGTVRDVLSGRGGGGGNCCKVRPGGAGRGGAVLTVRGGAAALSHLRPGCAPFCVSGESGGDGAWRLWRWRREGCIGGDKPTSCCAAAKHHWCWALS